MRLFDAPDGSYRSLYTDKSAGPDARPESTISTGSGLGGIERKEASTSLTEVQLFDRMEPFMTWLRSLP